jgi:hypothetical protein
MEPWEVGWDVEGGRAGVHREGDDLVWWYTPEGPMGHLSEAARVQPISEFLTEGAPLEVPEGVEQAVRRHLTANSG